MKRTPCPKIRTIALSTLAALSFTGMSNATDYIVTTVDDVIDDSDSVISLREAIIAANTDTETLPVAAGAADGDTITFDLPDGSEIVLTLGSLPITDDVSIDGGNEVTISGDSASRIFTIDTAGFVGESDLVSLSNITLSEGLAVSSEGDEGNGGAVIMAAGTRVTMSSVAISNSESEGDAAGEGGGAIFIGNGGELTLTGGAITDNIVSGAEGNGGAIFVGDGSIFTATGTAFFSNSAPRAGGAVEVSADATVSLTNVAMFLNLAGTSTSTGIPGIPGIPGFTEIPGFDSAPIITGQPGNGGAIHAAGGEVNIINGAFISNTAAREGGALWNNGSATMTISAIDTGSTLIADNIALGGLSTEDEAEQTTRGGGGIFNRGTMHIAGATIESNGAGGDFGNGGGIMNIIVPDSSDAAMLTITGSAILGNEAMRAGGGIENQGGGTVNLTNTSIVGNTATTAPGNGGGLHSAGGSITITGDDTNPATYIINDNIAGQEGGALWASGNLTVSGVTIDGNVAEGDAAHDGGGGIFMQGADAVLTLSHSVINGNTAQGLAGSGGGIFNNGGTMTISDTIISNHIANRAGGGIEDVNSLGSTLTTVELSDNQVNDASSSPGNGGAIHVTGTGTMTVTDSTIRTNSAANEGGGIWAGGSGAEMTINNSMFDGNTVSGAEAHDGGGALFNNGGIVTINNSTMTNNMAEGESGSGGAIFNMSGTLVVDGSSFSGNMASRAGGAIEDRSSGVTDSETEENRDASQSTVTITNSIFDTNATMDNPGNGGAIHITGNGVMDIATSTFKDNTAANEGGALWSFSSSTMTASNSTLSGNIANVGGGLFVQAQAAGSDGNVRLNSVTIARNQGSISGGGVHVTDGGILSAVNTIIAENISDAGTDVDGTISADYSLFGNTIDATVTGTNNQIDQDPMLEDLDANGATNGQLTHALISGPAVDTGSNTNCALDPVANLDQRGQTRPADGDGSGTATCDIGAFELTDNLAITIVNNDAETTAQVEAPATDVAAITIGVNNTSADTLSVSVISGELNGSLDLGTRLGALKIYLDNNADGAVDIADTDISSTSTIDIDDVMRTYSITFSPARAIVPGSVENYLLAVDINAEPEPSAASLWLFAPLLLIGGLLSQLRAKLGLAAIAMTTILTACGGGGGGGGSSSVGQAPQNESLQLTIDMLSITDSSGKAVIPTGLPKDGTLITITEE